MVVAIDDVLALGDLWTVSAEQVAALVEMRDLFTNISCKILRGEVPGRVDMHLLHRSLHLQQLLTELWKLEESGPGLCVLKLLRL